VKRASLDEDVKNKNLISKIVLRKDLSTALDDIEDYSHIYVIFWMHKISNSEIVLKVHPRGKTELPRIGVFATRAPIRPNSIGLTLTELIKRERNVLWVKGLDALDGTPVLDIKPYNSWDVVTNPKIPKWLMKINE